MHGLKKRSGFIYCLIITVVFLSCIVSDSVFARQINVLLLELEGGISPVQVHLLEDGLGRAGDDDHDLLLLRLDTPGGLGTSMREMVKIIMNSKVPVCVWVGPEGAHAASAGTFITAAAQVAAMAPGTSIGAASPVSSSGEELPETMSKKVTGDMVSLIKGIARKRGRNIEWYAMSVQDGISVDAQDAVTLNIVNFMALSVNDFLEQLGARGVLIDGQRVKFSKSEVVVSKFEPGFRYDVLSWLLDPQVAYFLLLGGVLGVFFELSHPGTILPGVIGTFCLVTGLYAMSILPTNAAGLLLLMLGAVLFILEIFIVSYGLLSLGAVISLFIGSLVLFREGTPGIPLGTILGTVLTFSVFAGIIIYLVTKAQLSKSGVGLESMIGLEGEVLELREGRMKVRVRGEIWNAETEDKTFFDSGTAVKVVQARGLNLIVVKKS
ncbi:nodulation protein NfeD [Desulfovibrio sp. JC022]|uniref:NfeD family protein n=1 Tax=Desulfovibrio sp. JC022 TaxID=2593642 RepID=UPI0013D073F7|nr:nodulation protein NfeD [Desulfovibrio sp. JC022]NDV24102.1 nodulation protein NfeD [Desulfovibrio sp. JC022]